MNALRADAGGKKKRARHFAAPAVFRVFWISGSAGNAGSADLFGDRALEEADDGAEHGEHAAQDGPDGQFGAVVADDRTEAVAFADAEVSRQGEEEYRADHEASRRDDLGEQAVARDQGQDAARQGQEEPEKDHDVEGPDGDVGDDQILFITECELGARIADGFAADLPVADRLQEHHAKRRDTQHACDGAGDKVSEFLFCHNDLHMESLT